MDHISRNVTKPVFIGSVTIGGNSPIAIQSMTNTKTTDITATSDQVAALAASGCELIRIAVPDMNAAKALEKLVLQSPVPLIADIHFDLKLAKQALLSGAAKIRVNPGNFGKADNLLQLAREAEKFNAALRIGVNAGSLEKRLLNKYGAMSPEALVESAIGYLEILESVGFSNTVISLKASDVYTTIKAYRIISEKVSYPLHIGITGAGPFESGIIKGAIGIGALLIDGIGDTVRVSLTADPLKEVIAARQILQFLGIRVFSPEIISCPTCGRCEIDLIALCKEVESLLKTIENPIRVAVMGCIVNGPGEAREADLGISAGKKTGILFRRGKVIKTVPLEKLLEVLKAELLVYNDDIA